MCVCVCVRVLCVCLVCGCRSLKCCWTQDYQLICLFPLLLFLPSPPIPLTKDLIQQLRSETSGNFRECIVALMEAKVLSKIISLRQSSFSYTLYFLVLLPTLLSSPPLPPPPPLLPPPPSLPPPLLFLLPSSSSSPPPPFFLLPLSVFLHLLTFLSPLLNTRRSMMPEACTVQSVLQGLVCSASLKSCAPVPTRRLPRSRRPTRAVSEDRMDS